MHLPKVCVMMFIPICFARNQMRFYKVNGRMVDKAATRMKTIFIKNPTDCLGECLHAEGCRSFYVYPRSSGEYHCDLYSKNPCGFIKKEANHYVFFTIKECKFHLRLAKSGGCVTTDDNALLFVNTKENSTDDSCIIFTTKLDGSDLQDNTLNEVKNNMTGDIGLIKVGLEGNLNGFQFIGSSDKCEIKQVELKKCFARTFHKGQDYLTISSCTQSSMFFLKKLRFV